jgi:hypothetical protein
LSWRNESEAPIVIPLCERAFDAHMKGLASRSCRAVYAT